MLLLEADRPLSVERLSDAVWDEAPPPTARTQIQIAVSAIRRALAAAGLPNMIATTPPGYLLRTTECLLDRRLFEQYVATARRAGGEGRATEAVTALRAALAMWRGEPLADVDSRLVRGAAVRLTERMLAVYEDCLAAELDLGRHHEVVGELMALVNTHPLRERLLAQLMVALYRSGRQAEALAAYRQARENLVEGFGLEPGAELRRLESLILSDDPELSPPLQAARTLVPVVDAASGDTSGTSVPQLLPADAPDFTGRGELGERLCDLLSAGNDPPAAGPTPSVPLVAVAGPGGVGKTTLAVHLAHRLQNDFPDGRLYLNLRGAGAQPLSPDHLLEWCLRVLGVPGQAIPDGIEQRAGMYRDRLAGRRVLVVLDDVADEGQVAPLLPGAHGCAVIATSRYRLTGLPGAHHVDLDVFSETDALDMLGNIMGRKRLTDEPDAAKELVSLCGQLPLAIRIAAARLAARPHWSIRHLVSRLSDDRRRLDELVHRGLGVRSAIALGHDSLARPAALLFCRLGILTAEDFPGWVAGALLDDDGTVAEDLLESLVDARLVDAERRAGSTRYRLHDLVRVYARERIVIELSAAERSQSLKRLLAAWLCLADHAHRRLYGGDYTVLHSEAPRWRVPPSTVDELLTRPLDWLEHERSGLVAAVGQAASAGFDDLCWDLAMTCVSLFEARGYFRDWRETHETALAAVGRSGNLLGQAAMRYSLGALSLVQHHMSEADELMRQALRDFDELGHQHGRSLTLRNIGYLQRVQGRSEASWSTYQEALHGLRTVGDRVAEAHVLRSLATLELERSNHLEAEKLLGHALDIARKVGNSRLHAQVMHRNGEMLLSRGDLEAAEGAFRVTLQLVHEIRDEIGEAYALYGLGSVHLRQGRRDPATGCLHRALVLAQENGERLLNGRVCLALSELYRFSGDLSEAARRAREATDQFDRLGADGRLLQAPSDVTPHAEGGPETPGGTFRP